MGGVKKVTYRVRPETAVLTRGFDVHGALTPELAIGLPEDGGAGY
jgi:hypothetical protein